MIPDISKWNLENAINISFLFFECHSLLSLPDISKWNLKCALNLNLILYGCLSLCSLPDIDKFVSNDNITQKINLFGNCINAINIYNNK